ncbi:MAG TPA: cytochrome c oxidase assembly protein [Gaiellaceae bacterium]|nr:cytochrome c oxidase assembly protein [Gaiellaceae bacterium]
MDPYAWSWNPEVLVILGLGGAYALAIKQSSAPRWRIGCFVGAIVLLLAVTVTPIHTLGMHFLLTMHLFQNVVLAEWAPLLVVLGTPPVLAARIARPRVVRGVTHPAVALPLWLANYMVWHLPWIYDAALRNPNTLLHLEHAMYFATGLAMWWSVFQDEPHRLGSGARAAYVFAGFILASPVGLVMALVPEPIYDFYVEAHHRVWGLGPLEDQQLAGMLMAVEQAVVFFAVFVYWFFRFLAEEERHEDVDPPAVAA